jgi:hypothetical protein
MLPSARTPEDIAFDAQWQPASGHPGGWRVVRKLEGRPMEELEAKGGRRPVLFKSFEAADRRARQMREAEHA